MFCVQASAATASPNPVAAYSFDEGSGSILTDSAGNHDGTISGATWTSTGKYGGALDFDGVDDLVRIADANDLDLTGSFTLEAWVNPATLTASSPVISKGEKVGSAQSGYLMSARFSGYPMAGVGDGRTAPSVFAPSGLSASTWSHLAFTSDGTTMSLYVDGRLVASKAGIAAAATGADLKIGRDDVLGGYFDGLIDEVRIYDEALSESQIQVDKDSAVGLDQAPVAAYSFDEGTGSTLTDSAGNHDGTITGATWAATGKYGSALDFDGTDDLVRIADANDLDLTGSFTLEAWVNPATLTASRPVISKGEKVGSAQSGYLMSARFSGYPMAGVGDGRTAPSVFAPSGLSASTWSHLAFTSDGTTMSLYIDGRLVASKAGIAAATTGADLKIGRDDVLGGYFDGLIDEVRIYDEALSESQIQVDKDNRIVAPVPQEVITTSLDTGPNSEEVSSLPITDPQDPDQETVIYSLEVSSITEGEVLRATANLELTNDQTYDVTDSVQLVLGSSATDANGEVVVPWSAVTHTPDMRHWTFPISGAYRATSNLGTQYLKVVAKAQSDNAGTNDTVVVQQNFGSLAVLRSTPATGPMFQPTHRLQPQIDPLPQLIDTLPIDSTWRRVMTRRVSELSVDDILDIASQIEIKNTSSATVKLESKITMTTTPSTGGSTASSPIAEQLSVDMPSARTVHATKLSVSDPAKRYFNLVVRAIPVSGSPSPLEITADTATLAVLRHEDGPGDPTEPLRSGTNVVHSGAFGPRIPSSLVAAYSFDEGTGTTVTDSARDHDGTITGATWSSSGKFGGALDFDGTDDLVSIADHADLDLTGTFTLEAWVRPEAVADNSPVFAKVDPSDGSHGYALLAQANGKPSATMGDGTGTSSSIYGTGPLSTNTWSHLAVTSNGQHMRLYINGVQVGDPRVITATASPIDDALEIGRDPSSGEHFEGLIDEVRIYNEPLDADLNGASLIEADRDGPVGLAGKIPYALAGGSEKRVVASAPIYSGTRKGEIINARGLVTGDLNRTGETTQILTRLILADSPHATTGETIGAFSGDKVPPSAGVHTSVKEGVYVMPTTEPVIKYVNFVAYASQANPTGHMNVTSAAIQLTRSQPTRPVDEGFEGGLDADGLDPVFEYEYGGTLSASTDVAREGTASMLVNADNFLASAGGGRRVEVRHPDLWASGGHIGQETWHGFSVYFPQDYTVPKAQSAKTHFEGLIDEVRIYEESLTDAQIEADMAGNYSSRLTPVAAYSFDEGTGSIAGDSAGNHDGAISGASWESNGKLGAALDFDGLDDEVRVPDSDDLDPVGPITVEAWVRPDSQGFLNPVVAKRIQSNLSAGTGYLLSTQALGGPAALLNAQVLSYPHLPAEAWSHLAFTTDGSYLRLYVNGILAAARKTTGYGQPTNLDLTIGANPDIQVRTPPPWNTIVQFHGHDVYDDIGCPRRAGLSGVASIQVRHFAEGEHTNPGQTETATPEDGEYLTAFFESGEIDEECTTGSAEDVVYVLAPLQREHWYDFVVHAKITQYEGTPGNSNWELWLDGRKTLGDQTDPPTTPAPLPVTAPSLVWRIDPELYHSTANYFQFGIFRGLWPEDPASRLYMDAIRTGNSYSDVAPRQ